MNKINPNSLRYKDQGNVHMDFHGATNTTIDFIIKKYGIETMNDIHIDFFFNGYKYFLVLLHDVKEEAIQFAQCLPGLEPKSWAIQLANWRNAPF